MVGWLVSWLVGNAVFSETALKIFLIFCMKLGDYKGRKVTEPDFWKKFLIWRYSRKGLQISPKSDTLIFFSKTALMIFLVFGLKLVLNMTFNVNESYFSGKFAIWIYLTSKSSTFGCFLTIRRSSQCILVSFFVLRDSLRISYYSQPLAELGITWSSHLDMFI